ncbi:choline transporter-like protein 2 [Ornithodoros turicata]|uniref:choline transporter-like protein 2 n=1 Tax=Ornithodoros turicata TaxID=34597 RepID=UPI0031392846
MPGLFLQPLLTSTCIIIFAILWLLGLICVVSVGHPYLDKKVNVVKYAADNFFVAMLPFYLLLFFWLVQIILNSQLFVIAASVSSWYFTRDKTHMKSPVTTGIRYLVCYHLGSIVFGSLIVACIKLLRALVKAIEYSMKRDTEKVKIFARIWEAVCQCVQKFLTFVNRNAFIVIAIHGYSFITSAKRAFTLLAQHAMDVVAINSVGDFVLFLAKVAVTVFTVLCGIEIMNQHQGVHYKWVPVFAGAILTYFVADSCISIYEMTIDTLFVCFCEDCEWNDGVTKPFFMSDTFKEFIEDSRRDCTTEPKQFK